MEYCEGGDLLNWIQPERGMEIDEVWRITAQLHVRCCGLVVGSQGLFRRNVLCPCLVFVQMSTMPILDAALCLPALLIG